MDRGEFRDAAIWNALRAARPRPGPTDPVAALGSLENARDTFLTTLRDAGEAHQVRHYGGVRHARHLASLWGRPLTSTVRATLFDAEGACVLVAVPADRKIEAPRLRKVLGVAQLVVLRADRGVGRLGWVNLPGNPGTVPGLPQPFGARLIVEGELLALEDVVVPLTPTTSVRVTPVAYLTAVGGEAVQCVGRTRLLPEGGAIDDPPSSGA
jgi:prolyl-tRNA editing enzyme YbaK/EbsC (Cys-tRNA(Pro) deacylase)